MNKLTNPLSWLGVLYAIVLLCCTLCARADVPPTTLHKYARVLVDANLPPTPVPNPKWRDDGKSTNPDARGTQLWIRNTLGHDYAVSLGFEECWVIGDGTLNRHTWWSSCTDLADFQKNGQTIPDGNFSDPPTREACIAVGKLLRNPQRFGATARPHCPAFIDFEGQKEFVCFPGYDLAVRKKYVRDWIKTLGWIQDGAGWDQELSIYGNVSFHLYDSVHGDDDDDELRELGHELNAHLSTTNAGFYFWDWMAENRAGAIFGFMQKAERDIRRFTPAHVAAKSCLVNPYYQVYWPANDLPDAAALNMTPVPFETWRRMIDWLVEHDYQIVLWLGYSDPYPIRQHMQYLAAYGRN